MAILHDLGLASYRLVVNYVRSSYQNDPFRVVLELVLLCFAIRYLMTKSDISNRHGQEAIILTEKEVDELVDDWKPEPLVNSSSLVPSSSQENLSELVTSSNLLFMSSNDHLGIRKMSCIKESAIEAVKRYGVGTCGPAGFYGTLDVHQEFQERIAKLLNVESALLLSQGYAAVAGVIPAFAKRNDIIVADEQVCFAIQRGMQLSRSHIYYYQHNDMDDLKQVLSSINKESQRKHTPLTRRFIITEGVFSKTGNIANLPLLMEIKNKFAYRLIVDESVAFGTIGPHGLGTFDYHGIDLSTDQNVILVASLSLAIGSCGGFTAGSKVMIDHQILSNQAYCYSASLPALFACSILKALDLIENLQPDLQASRKAFQQAYESRAHVMSLKGFIVDGHVDAPLRFLHSSILETNNVDQEHKSLTHIIAHMKIEGYALVKRKLVEKDEHFVPKPAIKIGIVIGIDWEAFFDALVRAITNL